MKQKNGLGLASLICGIVAMFCFNPLYVLSILAIVFGAISLGKKDIESRWMGVVGLIAGIVSIGVSVLVDILLLPFTFGLSFFF